MIAIGLVEAAAADAGVNATNSVTYSRHEAAIAAVSMFRPNHHVVRTRPRVSPGVFVVADDQIAQPVGCVVGVAAAAANMHVRACKDDVGAG